MPVESLLFSKGHIFRQNCASVSSTDTVNSRDDDYLGGLAATGEFCGGAATLLLQNKLPKPTYSAGIYKL